VAVDIVASTLLNRLLTSVATLVTAAMMKTEINTPINAYSIDVAPFSSSQNLLNLENMICLWISTDVGTTPIKDHGSNVLTINNSWKI
jgi:hypothetical protein